MTPLHQLSAPLHLIEERPNLAGNREITTWVDPRTLYPLDRFPHDLKVGASTV